MRMFSGGAVVAALVLSACASDPGTPGTGAGRCDDSKVAWAVGQPGSETNVKRLWDESGAGITNVIAPSTLVKRDSRQDRLRVYVDKDNLITAARCE